MRGFFHRLGNTVQYFMQGRYGVDELGVFLLIVGFLASFVFARIRPLSWISVIAFFVLIWAYVRIFSKNFDKRRRELMAYRRMRDKFRERISLVKRIIAERKTHRYFKCKTCKTRLRVPRGKGKIEITCPKCRTKIIKKT